MPTKPYPDGPKGAAFDLDIDVLTPELEIADLQPYSEHDPETGELIKHPNYTIFDWLTDCKERGGFRYLRLRLKPEFDNGPEPHPFFIGGMLYLESAYKKAVARGDINPIHFDVTYAV